MSQDGTSWEDTAGPMALSLADELERMAGWSSVVLEATDGAASEGDLLEDLEHRLTQLARRLRGETDQEPMSAHYPMEGEVR